jgi:uncharacterized membrane protein (DUF485 family)
MDQQTIDKIKASSEFQELASERSKLAWTLTGAMLVVYFAFILTIAFSKETLGAKLFDGQLMTLGVPVGVGIILFAFALTGIYVRKANTRFDALTEKVKGLAK